MAWRVLGAACVLPARWQGRRTVAWRVLGAEAIGLEPRTALVLELAR